MATQHPKLTFNTNDNNGNDCYLIISAPRMETRFDTKLTPERRGELSTAPRILITLPSRYRTCN